MAANLLRLDHLTSDQFSVGAMAQKAITPELFSRDPLYGRVENFWFYLPWYQKALAGLLRVAGSVGMAYWLLSCLCTLVMLGGFWLFYLSLGVRPMWAAAGAVLTSLPRLAPGQEVSGACMIETALPRTLFTMMLPVILALFLRSRGRGRQGVAAFFLVGLSGNAHLYSACFLTLAFMIVVILRDHSLRGWATAVGGGLAALLASLPSVIPLGPAYSTFAQGPLFPATMPTQPWAAQEIWPFGRLELLAWYAKVLQTRGAIGLAVFLACVAPMLLAAWVARRSSATGRSNVPAAMCLRCAWVLVFIGLAGGVVYLLGPLLGTRFFPAHQLRRAMRLVGPLAAAATVLWLGGADRGNPSRKRQLLIITLMLLPVAATVGGLEIVFHNRYSPVRQSARLAAQHSSLDAAFLVSPEAGEAFRVWARRSVVCSRKDLHFIPPFRRRASRSLVYEATEAYETRDVQRLIDLAQQLGADYVVIPPGWTDLAGRTPGGLLAVPQAAPTSAEAGTGR